MEDETILDLYFAREERAISETGKKYGSYCRSIAFNILHSHEDTEECVSDTYLHTWNTIPPTRPGCLRAFLGRITRNLSFTRWEAARAQKRGGGQTELISAASSIMVSLKSPMQRNRSCVVILRSPPSKARPAIPRAGGTAGT